ncbi:MAG: DUF4352 domain-containing protein [Clostridia bacterium]|nr:DUF4352 domain-containing protein [Clostridia bacterium]
MKKAVILPIAFVLLVSAAIIIAQREKAVENIGEYKYDKGTLGVAISRTMTSDAVIHNFGKPIYPDDRSLQYVWVYIKLVNSGTTAVQIKPEEFTLSVPGRAEVNYDSRATDSMQKRLNPLTLAPGKEVTGLLIFPVPESEEYALYYHGESGKIKKRFKME